MPNKKKSRIRNRPRNKANRLKLFENQSESANNIELIDTNEESDDDDMPGLMEDKPEGAPPTSQDKKDPIKTIQSLMLDNLLKKDYKTHLTESVPNSQDNQEKEDPIKTIQRLMRDKLLKKDCKIHTAQLVPDKQIETKDQSKLLNPKSSKNTNTKAAKSKEKSTETIAGDKNAFIQNLQKKMETMMANGDENLPNTLMEHFKKLFDQGPISDIESSDDEEEYIEYIYKPRKYFLVALCNLCKSDLCKLSQSIECSKCHMTYYCSTEHMHNDTEHQPLCYALQQVADSGDGHIFKNSTLMAADNFRSYRILTIRKVESILQRPLTATEQEVILFPRLCNNGKCREYHFDKLHDCSECGMISYCIDHPEHLKPEQHTKWCKSYQLFKELVQFQEQFGRLDPALPSNILKEIPLTCTNTKQIFNKLGFDIPENSEYATLTQISTAPLTAWSALNLTGQLSSHESLTIHLIGAEIEFEVDLLHKWELFFLHITPSVKNLNIVFVGPELNPRNISFEQLKKTKCCSVCRKSNRNVKYYFESYIYHDYCRSNNFLKPELICYFNAGLYRSTGYNMEDTWPATILAAANLQVPIVVTAYTEYESPLDMKRFLEECQRKLRIIQAPTENPFASVKPERNFISDDEAPLMFKNYYYFVVE